MAGLGSQRRRKIFQANSQTSEDDTAARANGMSDARGKFKCLVNSIVYGGVLAQVQLRLSREMLGEIDRWVSEGKFKNRSDAIKTIISFYEERERTREFLKMLVKRSEEARRHPESLVSLEEL